MWLFGRFENADFPNHFDHNMLHSKPTYLGYSCEFGKSLKMLEEVSITYLTC